MPIALLNALDTAYCNKTLRKSFLICLEQIKVLKLEVSIYHQSIPWISKRFDVNCKIVPFNIRVDNKSLVSKNENQNMYLFHRYNNQTTKLLLTSLTDESVETLLKLLTCCVSLKHITLQFTNSVSIRNTSKLVNNVLSSCLFVVSLNFESFQSLNDEHVVKLSVGLPALKRLNLSTCESLTDIAIESVAKECRMLEYLNISQVFLLTDRSLLALEIISALCLSNIVLGGASTQYSKKALDKLILVCGDKLREIDLSYIGSSSAVFAVSENCHKIRSLGLAGHRRIDDVSLISLIQNCKFIVQLNMNDLGHVQFAVFEQILKQLLHLSDFKFSRCAAEIENSVYFTISQKFSSISKLDILTNHVIGFQHDYMYLKPSSDYVLESRHRCAVDHLLHMQSKCHTLNHLVLANAIPCQNLDSFSLVSCAHLLTINLHTMINLTDQSLGIIANVCNSLVCFVMCACPKVTSNGVIAICEKNPSLNVVGLSGGYGFGCVGSLICDRALTFGIATLKNLHMLSIFHMKLITQAGFKDVILKCRRISDLSVHSCQEISNEFVSDQSKHCLVLNRLRFSGNL
jgi:hypothetical protein